MELEETRRNWDQCREDPLWAILGFPDRKNNRWKVDEFFETGRQEVDDLMCRLSDLHIEVARNRSLDFGCGVGRLTQALCRFFDRIDGIDIAESMIQRADEFNRFRDRCMYRLNTAGDLRLLGDATFDLVDTRAVLQHMEPRYSLKYIGEFVRVLKPGGVAVFESPTSYSPLGQLEEVAHKAGIELASGPPAVMKPGTTANLAIRVTNLGIARWPSFGSPHPILLGHRWLTDDGSVIVTLDGGRAAMPRLLEPGDAGVFDLELTAPEKAGRYIIELDMVEEGVTWFADQGSQTLRVPVQVSGPARHRPETAVVAVASGVAVRTAG